MTTYEDPLVVLLKDPQLNSEKDKSTQLLSLIKTIPQRGLQQRCFEGFQILRDLERIQIRCGDVSENTLLNCLELRRLLIDICTEIEEMNEFIAGMSPLDCISDPGTILLELSFRIIKLKNRLDEEISVMYSKARLITIGRELEEHLFMYSHLVSRDTVQHYKTFVGHLLRQLDECVSQSDTIGTMECIAVVSDVEKMFEAIRRPTISSELPHLMKAFTTLQN